MIRIFQVSLVIESYIYIYCFVEKERQGKIPRTINNSYDIRHQISNILGIFDRNVETY